MSTSNHPLATLIVISALCSLHVHGAPVHAESPDVPPQAKQLAITRAPFPLKEKKKIPERFEYLIPDRNSIEWMGQVYEIDAGIPVLMMVIRDPEQDDAQRTRALLALARIRSRLEGRPCLTELVNLFEEASELNKSSILTCLKASLDPRGIPLYMRILDDESNFKLRIWAAEGLAHWNIRRGVAELVELSNSDELMPQPSRLYYVRDYALRELRNINRIKKWGFRDEEVSASIQSENHVEPKKVRELLAREISQWFEENKHRFPEWHAGDPLPEIEKSDTKQERDKTDR